ncbi:MAG: tripartite tricarboxylate transporter substrate binding protein [Alphaproteobacteria bacterium]|nr:tripartite tricarboxylate transporter substrate binding protein [Alphaproteobacteria bacterium]
MRIPAPALKLAAICLALSPLVAPGAAQAQAFPSQPIQLVVPWPPGGGSDTAMRMTADAATKRMGVPVVVLNKPGAGGTVGIKEVMSSKPDGYMLAMIATGAIFAQYNNPNANALDEMEPVVFFGDDPSAITINPKLGFKNLKELVDYAKANPGKLKNGNDQPGGSSHVAASVFEKGLGIRLTKVPYAGFAPTVQALLSGEVDMASIALPDVIEQHAAGKLRILGVSAKARHFKAPEVPTFEEQGFPVISGLWRVIAAPKGTPADRLKVLEAKFLETLSDKEFQDRARAAGFLVTPGGGAVAKKRWAEDDAAMYPVFLEAGLVKTRQKK